MKKKAKIFRPDDIKTQICQAIIRDMSGPSQLHGSLSHDASVMYSYRQRCEIDKKYSSFRRQPELAALAFDKFRKVNEHMAGYTTEKLDLPVDQHTQPQERYSKRHNILVRARALVHFVLTPFQDEEWFSETKHGTGTSIGVSFSDTSLEAKSLFPVSCTRSVASLLENYLEYDSSLYSALLDFNNSSATAERYSIVEGSRATTVPKNKSVDRMIAVEPTGNMYFQQGLMAMMYNRLKACGLDLEILPETHKERALIASITSSEATIDWSSASDCVSTDLLRWLLPPKWFECCDLVRSKQITIGDESILLNMFSTMGNAVTFPLETLVFWSLGHAVVLEEEGSRSLFPEWKDLMRVSVFGDDCILPTQHALPYISMMESVGFIVNKEKSFFDDKGFRESCGGDYLRGCDVRPFYIKAPTSDRWSAKNPWLYTICNLVFKKYTTYFGPLTYLYDKEFFKLIFRLLQEGNERVKFVPPYFPDDAGLKMSHDMERLVVCYGLTLSPIAVNEHGTHTFTYHRFNYRRTRKSVDGLHFCTWLKKSCNTQRERSPWWQDRRKGGYVVARSRSCHWHVPRLDKAWLQIITKRTA
jgi:hypothetical protein